MSMLLPCVFVFALYRAFIVSMPLSFLRCQKPPNPAFNADLRKLRLLGPLTQRYALRLAMQRLHVTFFHSRVTM